MVNYSNLVYLHDLIESIVEHDIAFIITVLQANIRDDWVRKITDVIYTSKEELLPNGKRIDVFYKVKNFKRNICIGFEIKTGNEINEGQLREELEGLRSIKDCEDSFLILIGQEDPKFNIPYYFIPISVLYQKIVDVDRILHRFIDDIKRK
ncbi:MAG: hypothetical protein JHC28_01310 [Thermoprotei archaeon]|nr:hypothetical protein [Thermoprotei archaeon]